MAVNKDKVGGGDGSHISSDQGARSHSHNIYPFSVVPHTHKSAETALCVGTRGAVFDMEMSEISLLTD